MICTACFDLAVQINTIPESTIKIHPKWGYRYHEFGWKTVRQLLDFDAYQKCDLCKAFVSVVTVDRLNEYIQRTQETEKPIGVQPSHINDISVGDGPGNVIQWATFILGPKDSDQIMFPVWRGKWYLYYLQFHLFPILAGCLVIRVLGFNPFLHTSRA